jgi:hypothetical protein
VSQVGWVLFAVLLLTTCFFFWVGLLVQEEYRVCGDCGTRLG